MHQDFQKAFDNVLHQRLLQKMYAFSAEMKTRVNGRESV